MAKPAKKRPAPARPAGRRRKKKSGNRVLEWFVGLLFVLLILVGVAIALDYILFAFNRLPLFAITDDAGGVTEHIGLLYVVTESEGRLIWEWIWQKL